MPTCTRYFADQCPTVSVIAFAHQHLLAQHSEVDIGLFVAQILLQPDDFKNRETHISWSLKSGKGYPRPGRTKDTTYPPVKFNPTCVMAIMLNNRNSISSSTPL